MRSGEAFNVVVVELVAVAALAILLKDLNRSLGALIVLWPIGRRRSGREGGVLGGVGRSARGGNERIDRFGEDEMLNAGKSGKVL